MPKAKKRVRRRSIFKPRDETYTPAAKQFDKAVTKALGPVLERWYRRGYRGKELLYIANLSALHTVTMVRLRSNPKRV